VYRRDDPDQGRRAWLDQAADRPDNIDRPGCDVGRFPGHPPRFDRECGSLLETAKRDQDLEPIVRSQLHVEPGQQAPLPR